MEKTKNYDLKKPGQDDFYNVQDFDDNMEIIDEHMGKIENPVYDDAEELETLESGEKIGTAFGKIKLAISAFISHIFDFNNPHKVTLSQLGGAAAESLASHVQNKSNPHSVTKTQVGLGNCDNTADSNKSVKYAVSASFDAEGNQINMAYLKLSGGTMTGDINMGSHDVKINTGSATLGLSTCLDLLMNHTLMNHGTISNSNALYGAYSTGIYCIYGNESGLPIAGYSGYLLTIASNGTSILKILILTNLQIWVMSQKSDGTVISSWNRLKFITE